jgi:transposase
MEVHLNLEQVKRHGLCKAAIEGHVTNGEVAEALGLSVRQVQRIKRKVRKKGPAGVVHGNAGREPPNKKPQKFHDQVVELARTRYFDFTFSHMAVMLEEEQNLHVSDETLGRWLRPLGLGRPQRRTVKHRRRRERKPREGEMLFLDGSPHPWFGPDQPSCCLLLSCDDATGKPLRGLFRPQEDRDGCFEVCYRLFHKHGLPASFYIDRASQFRTTRHGGSHVQQSPETDDTHFERALKTELGIGLIFALSPQAKGRIERLNGSFQSQLVPELRLKGITDLKTATEYVNQTFIPRYAKRYGEVPADPTPAWRPIPPGVDLRNVLCAKYTRTVTNDTTVSFHGTVYQLLPSNRFPRLARAKIEVQQWFDGTIHFWYPEHGYLKAKPIPARLPQEKEAAQ